MRTVFYPTSHASLEVSKSIFVIWTPSCTTLSVKSFKCKLNLWFHSHKIHIITELPRLEENTGSTWSNPCPRRDTQSRMPRTQVYIQVAFVYLWEGDSTAFLEHRIASWCLNGISCLHKLHLCSVYLTLDKQTIFTLAVIITLLLLSNWGFLMFKHQHTNRNGCTVLMKIKLIKIELNLCKYFYNNFLLIHMWKRKTGFLFLLLFATITIIFSLCKYSWHLSSSSYAM